LGRDGASLKDDLYLVTSFDVCDDESRKVLVAVVDHDVFDCIGGRFARPG
jgi:hypothetical protein